MTHDIERALLDVEQPDAPAALRQRVLATAAPLVQPHDSRLDAIWFSQRWRLGAVLVFFGLIAADGSSNVSGGLPPQVEGPPVSSSVQVAVQAAIDAGLGKADVAAIAAQASLAWTNQADARESRGVLEFTGVPE